ncbi:MAG: ABC-type Fe3+-hydroxamate transport system substrate-binding protein [Hyphomicrobiaceae bacterium]|jgi:ABC-type Fe3+-hydroxamate transport system substrate-binding protein
MTIPARIVSLVPSLTETLLDWGLAKQVVGRTRWCTEPVALVSDIETVGGTKNPDVARIIELAPDLVIVNKEENRVEDVRELEAAGIQIYVTHPCSVAEAALELADLGDAVGARTRAQKLSADVQAALADPSTAGAPAADGPLATNRVRTFCPIWRRPWMTFRRSTYIGDVLACAGCDNIFANGDSDDEEALAGATDAKAGPASQGSRDFFEVTLAEVAARQPELVILPDEPYEFTPLHAPDLRGAGINAPILYVDGKDLSWYGPRIPAALVRLRDRVRGACGEVAS